jgi:hypothetical protein
MKSILIGAVFLAGTALVTDARSQYPVQYPAYPYNNQLSQLPQYQPSYAPIPATPPSWSYDPYTSGLSPCPQRDPRDSDSCWQQMPPTYGQPDYRPR